MTGEASTLTRLHRIATDYPVIVAGAAGAAGVLMLWQDIGPKLLGVILLLAGAGWYAYTAENDDNSSDTATASNSTTSQRASGSEAEYVEAEWSDVGEDTGTDEDEEGILDKFARVMGGDGDSGSGSDSSDTSAGLDPLGGSGGSLEEEAGLDFGGAGGLEADLELDEGTRLLHSDSGRNDADGRDKPAGRGGER